MRQDISLQEGVEIQDQQLVHSNHTGDDTHHGQPHLETLACGLVEPLEELLCKFLQAKMCSDDTHMAKE